LLLKKRKEGKKKSLYGIESMPGLLVLKKKGENRKIMRV